MNFLSFRPNYKKKVLESPGVLGQMCKNFTEKLDFEEYLDLEYKSKIEC